MICSINNLHPFSKNNHFFFISVVPQYVYTLQTWLFPWGACTGSFENLPPKWWRGALFCLNFTVRPMARIFWKGCKVLKKQNKNKKLLKVTFGKKYKKKKKIVGKSGPFIFCGCRSVYSGTIYPGGKTLFAGKLTWQVIKTCPMWISSIAHREHS